MAGDAKALADSFGMVEDPEGNAIIHEVELEEPCTGGRTPVAAVAVDLMGSLATRERSGGQRVIEGMLRATFQTVTPDRRSATLALFGHDQLSAIRKPPGL